MVDRIHATFGLVAAAAMLCLAVLPSPVRGALPPEDLCTHHGACDACLAAVWVDAATNVSYGCTWCSTARTDDCYPAWLNTTYSRDDVPCANRCYDVSWAQDFGWGLGFAAMFGVIVFLITKFHLESPSPFAVPLDVRRWRLTDDERNGAPTPRGVYHSAKGQCGDLLWRIFLLDTWIDFGDDDTSLTISMSNKPPILFFGATILIIVIIQAIIDVMEGMLTPLWALPGILGPLPLYYLCSTFVFDPVKCVGVYELKWMGVFMCRRKTFTVPELALFEVFDLSNLTNPEMDKSQLPAAHGPGVMGGGAGSAGDRPAEIPMHSLRPSGARGADGGGGGGGSSSAGANTRALKTPLLDSAAAGDDSSSTAPLPPASNNNQSPTLSGAVAAAVAAPPPVTDSKSSPTVTASASPAAASNTASGNSSQFAVISLDSPHAAAVSVSSDSGALVDNPPPHPHRLGGVNSATATGPLIDTDGLCCLWISKYLPNDAAERREIELNRRAYSIFLIVQERTYRYRLPLLIRKRPTTIRVVAQRLRAIVDATLRVGGNEAPSGGAGPSAVASPIRPARTLPTAGAL